VGYRYERGIAKPTIEVASKISQILEVSLDYLVGNSDLELDQNVIDRIVAIQKMDHENKKHAIAMLDAFIRDFKTKQAYK
jgi:transcriptional regulator with XRE-family HTH domain